MKALDFWLGCNWEDCDLAKALGDSVENKPSQQASDEKKEQPKQSYSESVKQADGAAKEPETTDIEQEFEFDQNIPF